MEFSSKKFVSSLFVIVFGLLYLGLVYGPYSPNLRIARITGDRPMQARTLPGGPVHALWGTITKIDSDYVVLDVPQVSGRAIPASLRERTVRISPATLIMDRIPKSDAQVVQEMRKYNPKSDTPPPSPYFERPLRVSDLQLGSLVLVQGFPGIDLGILREITATNITRS